MENREYIGNIIANYIMGLYEGNKKMTRLLERLFKEHPAVSFSRLKDKSVIATLNHTQTDYLLDGYCLGNYIRKGILHTVELNNDINRKWIFKQKIDEKTEYIHQAEQFEQLMYERYNAQ